MAIEEDEESDDSGMTAAALESKLKEMKAAGNKHFGSKSFIEAIASFKEAISLYNKNKETVHKNPALLTLVSQCYTNRSLGWHKLNNQRRALEDAEYVLRELDTTNAKALYRRAHALSKEGRIEEAIRDFKTLIKDSPTKEFITELSALQRKQKETEATQVKKDSPLIEEVEVSSIDLEFQTESTPKYSEEYKTEPEARPTPKRTFKEDENVRKLREEIAKQRLPVPKNMAEL